MSWTGIEFAPLIPLPVLFVFIALALGAAAYGYFVRARGTNWRTLGTAVLLLTLANPAIVEEQREFLKDVAVIILDESPSQDTGDRKAQLEAALLHLEEQTEKMRDSLEIRIVRIQHESIAAAENGTHLISQLLRTMSDVPERRVAGAVLITDGQVHDVPKMDEALKSLPGPVHVLLTGERNENDRRLSIVKAPRFGIVGKPFQMTIRVDDTAAIDGETRMTITVDGKDSRNVTVPVGRDHPVEFKLEHGGPNVFELSVDAGTDELTLKNNRAVVSVNGVRDRLRVLLVSGEPHPGERTWRNLLKSDPSVDLIHFTILRPPEKTDNTPIKELSLISFPTRELFEVRIRDFDLVIFDRYRRRGVLPPSYLLNIVDYVRDGGALLEAVGPTFASPYSIYRTPLGAALPGEPTGKVYEEGFRPEVTEMGTRHPVTADLPRPPSADGSEGQWGRWFRQVEVEINRGRVVMNGSADKPLLILDRFGKGRVAQLNSDHIWLWARGFEGGGPQVELLRRLSHWLMKEPELEENDIRATVIGDKLRIVRRNVDGQDKTVTLQTPGGESQSMTLEPTRPGEWTTTVPIKEAGLYQITDGQISIVAAAGALNSREFADLRATEELVKPAATATKGFVKWLADGPVNVRRTAPGRRTGGNDWIGLVANGDYIVTGVKKITLLPALLVFLLVLGAIAFAWRRESD